MGLADGAGEADTAKGLALVASDLLHWRGAVLCSNSYGREVTMDYDSAKAPTLTASKLGVQPRHPGFSAGGGAGGHD